MRLLAKQAYLGKQKQRQKQRQKQKIDWKISIKKRTILLFFLQNRIKK